MTTRYELESHIGKTGSNTLLAKYSTDPYKPSATQPRKQREFS